MRIKEILKDYYYQGALPEPFKMVQQGRYNERLKQDMEAWSQNNPALQWLNVITKEKYPDFHPDHVGQVCVEIFGTDVWEDLEPILNKLAVIDIEKVQEIFKPKLILKTVSPATSQEVLGALKGLNVHWLDSKYQVIDKTELEDFCRQLPAWKTKYVAESHDCDDFAIATKAYLAEQGYGNLACGYCEYNAYNGDEHVLSHAVNIIVVKEDGELKPYLIEPQKNAKIWNIDEPSGTFWGLGVDRIEVRFVMM